MRGGQESCLVWLRTILRRERKTNQKGQTPIESLTATSTYKAEGIGLGYLHKAAVIFFGFVKLPFGLFGLVFLESKVSMMSQS